MLELTWQWRRSILAARVVPVICKDDGYFVNSWKVNLAFNPELSETNEIILIIPAGFVSLSD